MARIENVWITPRNQIVQEICTIARESNIVLDEKSAGEFFNGLLPSGLLRYRFHGNETPQLRKTHSDRTRHAFIAVLLGTQWAQLGKI